MGQKSIETMIIAKVSDGSCQRRINRCDFDQYKDKGYGEVTQNAPALSLASIETLTPAPEAPEQPESTEGDSSDEFDALAGEIPETADDPSDALSDPDDSDPQPL